MNVKPELLLIKVTCCFLGPSLGTSEACGVIWQGQVLVQKTTGSTFG
jgi:hypothetical protein